MKKPWDTWVLRGLSINEATPLFEKMERMQMEPWLHAFGWKNLTLADGRKVKLTIQKNGVVPIYTAIAEPGGEVAYIGFNAEIGWLTWDIPEVGWVFPLRTYTTLLEREYALVSADVTPMGSGSYPKESWIPVIPPLDADGSYESANWLGDLDVPQLGLDQPHQYTGLARLWMQGCLALGKSPTALLATKYPFNVTFGIGKRLGVLRFTNTDGDFVWWMVVITAVGCWVMRMEIPVEMDLAMAKLKTQVFYHDLEATSVEAYILGNAELPDAPIQIKTEGEMDAVYQGRTHDRWDFCDQRFGNELTSSAKAIAIISGGMYGDPGAKYYTSHITRMTTQLLGGIPELSFEMEDSINWAMGTAGPRIYIPSGENSWYWVNEKDGTVDNQSSGEGAPIVAFHNPDGTEFIITSATAATETTGDVAEPTWTDYSIFCGAGSNEASYGTVSLTRRGFVIPGLDWARDIARARVYEQNRYTLVEGTPYNTYPIFSITDGFYYLTWGDDDCTGYQSIGPYTLEEKEALYPMVNVPVGAGTNIYTVEDTWSEQISVYLLLGYYPRSFGVIVNKETVKESAFTQTVTRLYDSGPGGDISQTIAETTAIIQNDVSVQCNPGFASVSTEREEKTFPDPTFRAAWRTEHEQVYEDLNSGHFSWVSGVEISYPGWSSIASFGGEEIVNLIGEQILPVGLATAATSTYDTGAFIGGA